MGLIISFGLAMVRAARFHTRFSTMEVARVVEAQGWGASVVMPAEVIGELKFWRENVERRRGMYEGGWTGRNEGWRGNDHELSITVDKIR